MTQTWRETAAADPLGLVNRHYYEEEPRPPGSPSPGAELLRLGLIIAAVIALGFVGGAGETVLLVMALIVCVVLHELGHYLAAKTGGVKVTEFFVGFGPRLWSVKRGETEYGVKALPLGGYCRIVGMNNLEEVDPTDDARTYRQAPLYRRLLIDFAGPGANFLIALVILFSMFFWTGDNGNYLTTVPANAPVGQIDAFANGPSPAQKAGLHAGDRIEAIDGRHFSSYTAMTNFTRASAGKTLDLTVDRGGKILQLHVTPVAADTVAVKGEGAGPTGKEGLIGFSLAQPVIHSGLVASVEHAGSAVGSVTSRTLSAFGHLLSFHGASSYVNMLSNQKVADNPNNDVRFSSPVKVVQIFHQASADGLATVLWVIAVINISLGIINLLPIFPLDGGRVVVALYEGVRSLRRPYRVDMMKLLPVLYVGLAFVAFIGLTSIFLDLRDVVA